MARLMKVSVPQDFSLSQSLMSYGHALLAPNSWTPGDGPNPDDGGVFSRPLRYLEGDEDYTAIVTVRQKQSTLFIEWADNNNNNNNNNDPKPPPSSPSNDPSQSFLSQIHRCLRITEDLSSFHALHPSARQRKWGRTYRSPTPWEDVVRTITNCNMQWAGTCDMNRKLCSALGTPMGSFPTPAEIVRFGVEDLSRKCRLGYRAVWIREIADRIVDGRLDLEGLERAVVVVEGGSGEEQRRTDAERRLRDLPGIGPFAHANILQLFGRTDVLPLDTESCRLWAEEHGAERTTDAKRRKAVMGDVEAYYRTRYPGHEWRAYWFDLWRNYEGRRVVEGPRWVVPLLAGEESAFSFRVCSDEGKGGGGRLRKRSRVSLSSSGKRKCGERRSDVSSRSTRSKVVEDVGMKT